MSASIPKTNAPDLDEIEETRRQRIDELREDEGETWLARFAPGTLGCHELFDRTAMLADMVEQFLCEHPACAQDTEWFRLAANAAESLHELYQRIGAAHAAAERDDMTKCLGEKPAGG